MRKRAAWATIGFVSTASVLAYIAAIGVIAWGVAHVAPTKAVADGFGAISTDNRRIFVMEWIAEGITHVSVGVLVVLLTAIEGAGDPASQLVYRVAAAVLVVLAALTAMTGARTPAVWFRICPFVLSTRSGASGAGERRVAALG